MKFLVALAVVWASPLHAQAFEGVLHMITSIPSVPPIKTDVSIRSNGDTRTDTFVPFANQRVSLIQRRGGASVTELLHDSQQYTESTMLTGKAATSVQSAMTGASVVQLGVESIAGYVCKHAQIQPRSGGAPIEVWVTDAIRGEAGTVGDLGADAMRMLVDNGLAGFPLKVRTSEQGIPITIETVSVEARAVQTALFDVPASYKKVAEKDAGIHELSFEENAMVQAYAKQLQDALKME